MKRIAYIKIVTGLREDQTITIPAAEAHKAYFLFNNRKEYGTFSNGVSIIGSDIRQILPDYHATMGWNETHKLTGDDWNVLRREGVEKKLLQIMGYAREVAEQTTQSPHLLKKKLSEAAQEVGILDANKKPLCSSTDKNSQNKTLPVGGVKNLLEAQ